MDSEKRETKFNNKWLFEKQLETLKIFYERRLLKEEQYKYAVKVLTTSIDITK